MYYFLLHLALVAICYTSTVTPKLIADLLVERKTISYAVGLPFCGPNEIDHYFCDIFPLLKVACTDTYITSVLVIAISGGHIVVTGHDNEEEDPHIAKEKLCEELSHAAFRGAGAALRDQTDHYFCDVFPLLKLACTDTSLLVIAIIATTGMLSILTFVALVISYIIVLSTLRTRSSEGRRKALSTCGSHVTVVFMFFLPLIFTYVPMADSVSNDKVFALFYTMIAPMFNPLIYTLRNTDMKNAMRRVWCRHRLFEGK
ncbi:Olfactory Receptor 4P4 [Manis pentadactyla]|nr:Olfactory Receptor 4P4 [Manis pentadactyla]